MKSKVTEEDFRSLMYYSGFVKLFLKVVKLFLKVMKLFLPVIPIPYT